MNKPEVSILIPNYKTPELTKLCLRSLRKHTALARVRVIVIDNDSGDASLDYLRQVEWIELAERKTDGESGFEMHARALDFALERVDTPEVLVMHTDSIVIRDGWLDYLLAKLNADPQNGGVGSWKLEIVSPWKSFGKALENFVRRLCGREIKTEHRYFRSHCALYKTDLIKRETRGFYDGTTAGKSLFDLLCAKGYHMPFLPATELSKYLRHLNHATII